MNPLERPLFQILRIIASVKPQLIDAMGLTTLEFIDDNFARQEFQDTTPQVWPGRKKKDKGRARKILVDTGALRRSFKQVNAADHTTVGTDIPYAQIHNDGGTINHPSRGIILSYRHAKGGKLRLAKTQTENQQRRVKELRRATIGSHTTTMPPRKFIGESPVLSAMCEKAVLKILIAKLPQ